MSSKQERQRNENCELYFGDRSHVSPFTIEEYLNNIMSSDAFESAHAEVTSTFYLHVRSSNCY